jgi:hypothetical protein
VPYIDSHCHIDFILKRSLFDGTWSQYMTDKADTFMNNYAGCVTNFCDPNMYRASEYKNQLLFMILGKLKIISIILRFVVELQGLHCFAKGYLQALLMRMRSGCQDDPYATVNL